MGTLNCHPSYDISLIMKQIVFVLCLLLGSPVRGESLYEVRPLEDAVIAASALTVTTILYGFDDKFYTLRCPCSPDEVNAFDRGVIGNNSDAALVATDIALGAAIAGPVLINFHLRGGFSTEFFEDIAVFAQVLAVVGALTSVSKAIFQRPLPRTYTNDPTLVNSPRGYRSFFSGHVATTSSILAAAAYTFGQRNELGPWPWIALGGFTVGVAAGRIAGGVHFYTDVIVGAAVGIGGGILIPWLHRRAKISSTSLRILPHPSGLMVAYAW